MRRRLRVVCGVCVCVCVCVWVWWRERWWDGFSGAEHVLVKNDEDVVVCWAEVSAMAPPCMHICGNEAAGMR